LTRARSKQRKDQKRLQDYSHAVRRTYELLLEWCYLDPENREKDYVNRVVTDGTPLTTFIEETVVAEIGHWPIQDFGDFDKFPVGLVLNR
jgi:hypothetical protein